MEQETEAAITPPDQPSISLQDLVLLLNLVRISADRGAIKAEEMSEVGAVYQKLFAFLKASGAIGAIPEESKETN